MAVPLIMRLLRSTLFQTILAVTGSIVGLVAAAALIMSAYTVARYDKSFRIGQDSNTNYFEAANAEIMIYSENDNYWSCSGTFIGPTGQLLTAAHCLPLDYEPCSFDPDAQTYPSDDGTYVIYVQVAGVNGTSEKLTFTSQIAGWSGYTDIMLLQTHPYQPVTGSNFSLSGHPYLTFADSTGLERGQMVTSLAYDYELIRKLGHKGAIQAVHKDHGTWWMTSSEQVFYDGNIQSGASGSSVVNTDGQIVIAPITYSWDGDSSTMAASGTSSRISSALTSRMRTTSPNGPVNKFLVPTLGLAILGTIDSNYLRYQWNEDYLPLFQNKGLEFGFSYDQDFWDFYVNDFSSCNLTYTVTPPSSYNAPLSATVAGTPPDPLPQFPADDESSIIVLEAIERTLNAGNWVDVGSDTGSETVSGVLISSGKWVGDDVRIKVRSANPYLLEDPTNNWVGIYTVTLQAIDPFWDILDADGVSSIVSHVFIDNSDSSHTRIYQDPYFVRGKHAVNAKYFSKVTDRIARTMARRQRNKRNVVTVETTIPAGLDIYSLPTLADLYLQHKGKAHANRATRKLRKPKGKRHVAPKHKILPKAHPIAPKRLVRRHEKSHINVKHL
jgi:hypothetical protein